jgi:hypothetical protein
MEIKCNGRYILLGSSKEELEEFITEEFRREVGKVYQEWLEREWEHMLHGDGSGSPPKGIIEFKRMKP